MTFLFHIVFFCLQAVAEPPHGNRIPTNQILADGERHLRTCDFEGLGVIGRLLRELGQREFEGARRRAVLLERDRHDALGHVLETERRLRPACAPRPSLSLSTRQRLCVATTCYSARNSYTPPSDFAA